MTWTTVIHESQRSFHNSIFVVQGGPEEKEIELLVALLIVEACDECRGLYIEV